MEAIRWAIIGCGDVTERKSGPAFNKVKGSKLVAVMRRDAALAADYAKRHEVPRWTTDADELITDPDIDAIYVATPPASHRDYVLRSAAAGKPVYVEKPMAVSYQECLDMVDACAKANVPLFVAYYRRALPRFRKIRQLLSDGTIGDVRLVTIKQYQQNRIDPSADELPWRVRPGISGGGLFVDLAAHTLDIFDFLLGPITEVYGQTSNQGGFYEPEDTVSASLRFGKSVLATAIWNFCAYEDVDYNEIIGTAGKIAFSTFGTEPIRLFTESGTTEIEVETPYHIQQPLIQTIVEQLHGGAPAPSTGVTAARTNAVMDTILGRS